jgi:hypothetical protein
MDAFYYWKDHDADMKSGRIGHFRSKAEKVKELAEGYPDYIWVFKTPPGKKGEAQLLARLKWSDTTVVPFKREPDTAYILYDPHARGSVRYTNSASDSALRATKDWLARNFPKMAKANFQGTIAQEALRGRELEELNAIARSLTSEPFMQASLELEKQQQPAA